jgi:hypothetical protein
MCVSERSLANEFETAPRVCNNRTVNFAFITYDHNLIIGEMTERTRNRISCERAETFASFIYYWSARRYKKHTI